MVLLKDLLMSLILCVNSCLNKNKINAMKILYPYRIIFIITLLLFCDDIYGGSGKVFQLIEKHGIKYIDYLFHYAGLMGLLAFMKAISWSKMLLGGFLSIVGAFYPNKKERSEGEAHIEVSKFKLFIKGSIKFTLVIVGAILIIGSVVDGFKEKDSNDIPVGSVDIKHSNEIIKINDISVKKISEYEVQKIRGSKADSSVNFYLKKDSILKKIIDLNKHKK